MELLGIPGFGRNADMDIDNEQVIQSFVTGAGTFQWWVWLFNSKKGVWKIDKNEFYNWFHFCWALPGSCDFMMKSVRVLILPNSAF